MFVRIEFESKQLLVKSASAQYNLENTEESFDNNSEVWLYSNNWILIFMNCNNNLNEFMKLVEVLRHFIFKEGLTVLTLY